MFFSRRTSAVICKFSIASDTVNPLEQMHRHIVMHLYNFFIFNQKNIFIVLQVVYIIVFKKYICLDLYF